MFPDRAPLAVVALALALSSPAHAGDERTARPGDEPPAPSSEGKTDVLRVHEEITVTASKTPQPPRDVTQTVRVLDARQIADLPAPPNRNVSELLRYQPGVFVSALSRNDANWGSNGGLGPKYSSSLLDGVPIDAFVGETLDLTVRGGVRLDSRRWGEDLYPASLALREHDVVRPTGRGPSGTTPRPRTAASARAAPCRRAALREIEPDVAGELRAP